MAGLRATDLMNDLGAALPENGLGLFVTDTLDDPHAEQTQLGSGLELVSRSRSRAAKVKAKQKVTVVIGNPPCRERAEGLWIDVSPEGIRPDVTLRIFPGVQQPLAITLFVRRPDCDPARPRTATAPLRSLGLPDLSAQAGRRRSGVARPTPP